MATIKAIVSGNVAENRLLKLSVKKEGLPSLRYATDGFPHFHSTTELENGQEVEIKITNKPVWKIEAGESIKTGEAVYGGSAGKVFSRKVSEDYPSQLIGYAANDAKEGEIVSVVRNFQMNGNWIAKVNDAIGGDEEQGDEEKKEGD